MERSGRGETVPAAAPRLHGVAVRGDVLLHHFRPVCAWVVWSHVSVKEGVLEVGGDDRSSPHEKALPLCCL